MDLSTMSISQLRDLQQQIPVEIKRREAEEKVNALNELRAFAKSRGYAIEDLLAVRKPNPRRQAARLKSNIAIPIIPI
jgi:cupin superfamily acireductone dioxygenase involved in methionine salvage